MEMEQSLYVDLSQVGVEAEAAEVVSVVISTARENVNGETQV